MVELIDLAIEVIDEAGEAVRRRRSVPKRVDTDVAVRVEAVRGSEKRQAGGALPGGHRVTSSPFDLAVRPLHLLGRPAE
ncbi:MAG: hypothetical protein ACJ73S_18840 [Mycobacteriales bacterium]